jgi:hypothetical protein
MSQYIRFFLLGLTVLSPAFSLGLLPSSYQGMTRRPSLAVPYATAGLLYIILFPLLVLLPRHLLPLGLHRQDLALPMMVAAFWLVQGSLGLALARFPSTRASLSIGFSGCLALGSAMVLAQSTGVGLAENAAAALGMAAGYWLMTAALSYLRERIDPRMPRFLAGWPVLLLLCSSLWLAMQALGVDLP